MAWTGADARGTAYTLEQGKAQVREVSLAHGLQSAQCRGHSLAENDPQGAVKGEHALEEGQRVGRQRVHCPINHCRQR